ncbi:flagellar assembly protein FliW [Magnetofaba australis]|uniref:Flagellar assembly factor FliW n=1 Tax=Magnetofaba australis IT-1 TaxID=1434232 RepID=A0A1Y2K732_9PROT|nr:flagellar assembly protein FliW [Magnetofaba australis]OSM06104.1 putative flagellar assembly factor FliW [Magnetofaba australis IT-1]
MEIQGTRFGELEFDENEIIYLNEGLLGFPLSKRFLLFPYGDDSSFFWLQSVDEPEIAFIVINPFEFFADLEFAVEDDDAASLSLARSEDVEIFTLVTIPEGRPEEMRTNLAGPVVVNVANRQGKQVLCKQYSPRQPLIPESMRASLRERTQEKRSGRAAGGR